VGTKAVAFRGTTPIGYQLTHFNKVQILHTCTGAAK